MSVVLFLLALIADAPPLRWGGDAEGGAPFVEADPRDPSKVRGFDVEVAEEIAKGLGRRPEFVQVAFNEIDQSVERGDFDIGMSGVEDTPARRAAACGNDPLLRIPRSAHRARRGSRSLSHDGRSARTSHRHARRHDRVRLLAAEKSDGVICVSYDDDVHPYADLRQGRLDAVLLDNIIAARSMRSISGLFTQPQPVATGHYIGVLATGNTALRDRVNEILKRACATARWSGFIGSGESGTSISPRF